MHLRISVAAAANFSGAFLIAYTWNEITSHSEGEEFFTFCPPPSLTHSFKAHIIFFAAFFLTFLRFFVHKSTSPTHCLHFPFSIHISFPVGAMLHI